MRSVQEDFLELGTKLPHPDLSRIGLTAKLALIVILPAVIFWSDLMIVFSDALKSSSTSYVFAIPFIVSYLVYRKREMLRSAIQEKSLKFYKSIRLEDLVGVLFLSISIILYWYGSYTFNPLELHLFALPLFISSLILIFFNIQTLRQLLFPLLFLLFLVPIPFQAISAAGSSLSTLSSQLAYYALTPFFQMSLVSEYGTPTIMMNLRNGTWASFSVDVACSGINSLVGFLVFAFFIAYLVRDKLWKRTTIFGLGVPLVYSLNVFRIIIILFVGYFFGVTLALEVFHLMGGWLLIFVGTILLLLILERFLHMRLVTKKTASCPNCNSKETKKSNDKFCFECGRLYPNLPKFKIRTDMPKIVGVALLVMVISFAQPPVFNLTQGPAELSIQSLQGQQATTEILPQISGYDLYFQRREKTFEEIAEQDAALVYGYIPNEGDKEPIWVALEIAGARTQIHMWETCLINYPTKMGQQVFIEPIESNELEINQNPPVIARYFSFVYNEKATQSGLLQSVVYWYETSYFKVGSSSELKYVKISASGHPETEADIPAVKEQLEQVATEIIEYWQPVKTWSIVTLQVSQNGDLLIVANLFLLGLIILTYLNQKKGKKQENKVAYKKISAEKRQLIDAIRETEKDSKSTLDNIARVLGRNKDTTFEKTELLEQIVELEKMDLVRKALANRYDDPVRIWKTNLSII